MGDMPSFSDLVGLDKPEGKPVGSVKPMAGVKPQPKPKVCFKGRTRGYP